MNSIRNKKDLETVVDELRGLAHTYLEKYYPSKQQIRIYLLKKFLNKMSISISKSNLLHLIDDVILNLEEKKLINDKLYSDSRVKNFIKRGYSINKIRKSLIQKGIDFKYIKKSLSEIIEKDSDIDFFSAMKICKKRRIGPVRDENNRPLFYKKDIGFLARSGFSYEISKRVLDIPKEEFKKFCKIL